MRTLLVLLALVATTGIARAFAPAAPPAQDPAEITVYLRNPSAWFRPLKLVVFEPGREGYVESKMLLPKQRVSLEVPPGTAVYLVDREQLTRYYGGEDLRALPPSLTIHDSDAGEEYAVGK